MQATIDYVPQPAAIKLPDLRCGQVAIAASDTHYDNGNFCCKAGTPLIKVNLTAVFWPGHGSWDQISLSLKEMRVFPVPPGHKLTITT